MIDYVARFFNNIYDIFFFLIVDNLGLDYSDLSISDTVFLWVSACIVGLFILYKSFKFIFGVFRL